MSLNFTGHCLQPLLPASLLLVWGWHPTGPLRWKRGAFSCQQGSGPIPIKLRSHMRGAVAERTRAIFLHSALLPRVCLHIRGADMVDLPFFMTKMVWGARFRSGRGNWVLDTFVCGVDFAPTPPPLRDHICVNASNDLCWSQFSIRLCLRPLRACANAP